MWAVQALKKITFTLHYTHYRSLEQSALYQLSTNSIKVG
jgi:hypothetical protein